MAVNIPIRVGIDFDNDGRIHLDSKPTDTSNRIPLVPHTGGLGVYHNTSTANNLIKSATPVTPGEYIIYTSALTAGVNQFYYGYKNGYGDAGRLGNASPSGATQAKVPKELSYTVVTVSPSTYSMYMWVKQVGGSTGMTGGCTVMRDYSASDIEGSASSAYGTPSSVTLIPNQWVRVLIQANETASSVNVRLAWKMNLTYTNSTLHGTAIEFKEGFIDVRTGSAPDMPDSHNWGTSYLSADNSFGIENITDYLLDAEWSLGNTDIKERLPADGTAMIVLDNSGGEFLPNNTQSPFYGKLKPRLRMKIQVYNGSAWVDMWGGVVKSYKFVDGNPLEKRVRIECEAPVFSLVNERLVFTALDEGAETVDTITAGEAINRIVNRNTTVSANVPTFWRLGSTRLNTNTILADQDSETVYQNAADRGVPVLVDTVLHNRFKYVGSEWDDFSYAQAMKAIVDSEYGFLFQKRDGGMTFYDRYAWHDYLNSSVNIDLNSVATEFVSEFGEDIRNSVSVDWRNIYRAGSVDLLPEPFIEDDVDNDDDEVIDIYWKRKTNLPVTGVKAMKRDISKIAIWSPDDYEDDPEGDQGPIDYNKLHTRYRAGGTIPEGATILDFDSNKHKIISLLASNADRINAVTTDAQGSLQPYSVIYEASTPGGGLTAMNYTIARDRWKLRTKNNKLRIKWFNASGPATWTIDPVMIRAVVNINEGKQTLTMRNDASILEYGNVYGWDVSNSLYVDELYAKILADQMLADYVASGIGVRSLKMVTNDRDSTVFSTIMSASVGTDAYITEHYLGLSAARHIVIHEAHHYANHILETELTLVNAAFFATAEDLADILDGYL